MQVFTILQHSTAKEIPRLTRHTATLTQFYFEPTGASQSFTQTQMKRKRELRLPCARRPSARPLLQSPSGVGARSSCLHVHTSIARVARG